MSKFVLTAQLQLKAPANTKQVVSQMRRQLSGINVNVGVRGAPQAQKQVAKINQQVQTLNKSGARLGKTFGLAINRFAAFTVASRAVSLFTNGLANATKEAIAFERELVKISQVTGKSVKELSGLSNTITQLSVNLGTSSKDLLATSRILAQTGLEANNLEVALKALAKTTLAPTFEDITKTAEGAVAILAQFGQGVGALESQLGAINAVAGQFAVESGDLISVVRRTGGVFKAAGGDLNELLALFTSVRATTRESAESIATGLRTIFTRIQRPKTIEFLKQFGVELVDLNGKFVGPFEAVKQLSNALAGLGEGDIRFVQIAEELGGFRQIGKVIPLLQQFETAERARQAALEGGDSLTKDAATAQQALAIQITKVKEEFLALVRSISQTGSFQTLVKTTLDLASALISVADALKPIIPLLTAFAGIKLARGLTGFGAGLGASLKGGPRGFNSGGLVPGTGNRDTVPAMLTPGEFVIRKSSVEKMGASTLAEMNGNKFNKGGKQKKKKRTPLEYRLPTEVGQVSPVGTAKDARETTYSTTLASLRQRSKRNFLPGEDGKRKVNIRGRVKDLVLKKEENESVFSEKSIIEPMFKYGDSIIKRQLKAVDGRFNAKSPLISDANAKRTIGGFAFESFTSGLSGISAGGEGTPFDFTGTAGSRLSKFVEQEKIPDFVDAKRSQQNPQSILKKVVSDTTLAKRLQQVKALGGFIKKFALGGLALKNRVGFAILDPDRKAQDMDAKVTRAQIRGAVKGTEGQRKALDKELSWANKNFKVARQGLNTKTSQKFYDTLSREAAQGVSVAAAGLSNDLGLGSITVPETSKQLMADSIRKSGSMMGKIFEDVVNVMDGRGKFSPSPPGAPFDFKGGLQGALKDNYDRLPSTFVDAKTSYGEATVGEAQKKIINELAQTYQQTPTYANSKKGDKKGETQKQAAARAQRTQKGQARLAKLRAKAGYNMGGAAPSDTVPALLTPGEFVINKKAASKIGKANLDRMNKQGVKGFAAGGVVQKFANGGAPYSTPQRFDSKGFPVAASAQTQSSGTDQVKKASDLLARGFKTVTGAIKDVPGKFKSVGQSAQQAVTNFKQSEGFKTTSQNIKNEFAKVGDRVREGEKKVKRGFNLVGQTVKQNASQIKTGLGQYKESIQRGATSLKGSFDNVTSTISTKGKSGFERFFNSVKGQAPKIQEAFGKVSTGIAGSIKKIIGPLDRAATQTQKTAGKLSAASNAVRGPIANPAQGTAFASKDLQRMLQQQGASARRTKAAMSAFIKSINRGDSATKALSEGMKKGGVSIQSLEKAARKAAIADEKAAKAAELKRKRDEQAAAGGAGGGRDMMGAFFALQGITAMIPRVEGATEGLGALSNKSIDLVMQLGTLAFAASSLGLNFKTAGMAFTSSVLTAGAAIFAATQIIDAYTGVHEKAKKAIEEGNISEAGTTAVASKRASAASGIAIGGGIAAAAGGAALIGSIFGPIGTAVGAALGAVAGIAFKLASTFEIFDDALDAFRDNFLVLFGADTTAMVKERAEAEAAAAKATKEATENTKKLADAMKEVEAGNRSLLSVLQDEGSANINNLQASLRERQDVTARERKFVNREVAKEAVLSRFGMGREDRELGGMAASALTPIFGQFQLMGKIVAKFTDNEAEARKQLIDAQLAEEEVRKQIREEQLKLLPNLIKLSRGAFVAGQDLEGFKKQAANILSGGVTNDFNARDSNGQLIISAEVQAKALRAYQNNIIAVTENTEAFAASNMGLRPLRTFVDGLSTSLDRTSSILSGKFNSLGSAVDIVGSALSGAVVDSDVFDRSLSEINSNLASFGVSSKTIGKVNTTFNALRTASSGFGDALEKTQDFLLDPANQGVDGQEVQKQLIDNLANLPGLGEEGKQIIRNIFSGIEDLNPDEIAQIQAGNFDVILSKLDEAGAKAFEEINETSKALVSAQNKLLSITQKRAEAELKAIEAQKKAISLQEEAAGILAEAAGKQLSSEEKLDFNRRRLSADLRGGPGSDGSVAGIMTRIGQIQAGAAGATSRLSGIAGGGEGDTFQAAEDQRSLADSTRQLNSLAEFARKRVQIYKQELDIVKKKNALEKSSLEKLIAGDTLGFIEDQSAVAAQAALRSGDKALASLFSSKALATAFKNLEEQGLSDAERRTAAATALGPGFASARNVGVLTGTTSEEKALRAGMTEQARILNAIAPAIQQLGSANFEIATAGLQFANDQFVSAQQKAAAASEKFAQTMEKSEKAAADQRRRLEEQEETLNNQIAAADAAAEADRERVKNLEKDRKEIDEQGIVVKAGGTVNVDGEQVKQFARGGMVYASRGMFVPRGTDTVPAMLTPGEFVVNRAAVQRGNNLQLLKSMNGNGAAPAPAAEGMSNGGVVYRSNGSRGPETGGVDMNAMFKTFESSAKVFNEAVNKLVGFKLNVQLDPTNVNVNLNGGTFLNQMKDSIKDELLAIVSERIRGASFDNTGDFNLDPVAQRIV